MTKETELLEKAIQIAVNAHAGQKDRYGAPYILHATRVMQRLTTPEEKITGVLHDVVEDTDWTVEKLAAEGIPQPIIAALKALTKKDGEEYDTFVKRSAANPLAKRVKLADLQDNMDLRRMPEVTEKDVPRLEKYLKAWKFLSGMDSVH